MIPCVISHRQTVQTSAVTNKGYERRLDVILHFVETISFIDCRVECGEATWFLSVQRRLPLYDLTLFS